MLIERRDLISRAREAESRLKSCRICPRSCGVDRTRGEKGFCGLDSAARCFRDVVVREQEPEIGLSHQVYFAGCNLRCEFCTVREWNESPFSAPIMDAEALGRKIEPGMDRSAKKINFLGGEPTCSVAGILELLKWVPRASRVIWNTNLYISEEGLDLLADVVDIYLADLKCGNRRCAGQLLGAGDYYDVVRRNLRRVAESDDLIVRHLLLPGHENCCLKPILHWLKRELPGANVSLRGDYFPPAEAQHAPTEYTGAAELKAAVAQARELGLKVV